MVKLVLLILENSVHCIRKRLYQTSDLWMFAPLMKTDVITDS